MSRLIPIREVFDAVYTNGARKNRGATERVTGVPCRTFWDRTNMVLGHRDFRPLLPARPLVSKGSPRDRCGFTSLQSVTAVFRPLLLRVRVTGDRNYILIKALTNIVMGTVGNVFLGSTLRSASTCAAALTCPTRTMALL